MAHLDVFKEVKKLRDVATVSDKLKGWEVGKCGEHPDLDLVDSWAPTFSIACCSLSQRALCIVLVHGVWLALDQHASPFLAHSVCHRISAV